MPSSPAFTAGREVDLARRNHVTAPPIRSSLVSIGWITPGVRVREWIQRLAKPRALGKMQKPHAIEQKTCHARWQNRSACAATQSFADLWVSIRGLTAMQSRKSRQAYS